MKNLEALSITLEKPAPQFGGWLMPVQDSGILEEHHAVGRVSLRGIAPENGGVAFGLAADKIASLTVQQHGKTERLRNRFTARVSAAGSA